MQLQAWVHSASDRRLLHHRVPHHQQHPYLGQQLALELPNLLLHHHLRQQPPQYPMQHQHMLQVQCLHKQSKQAFLRPLLHKLDSLQIVSDP